MIPQEINVESWMPVVGYENYYEVSKSGFIRTIRRGRLKAVNKTHNGYIRVQLSKDGVNKDYPLHRLIIRAFCGDSEGRPYVNHKNGIKADNRLENLEWCTHKENIRHSILFLGRKPPKTMFKKGKEHISYGKGDLKSQCKAVLCTTLGLEFPSIRKAARELGLNNANICSSLRGRCVHVEGLTFRYI